MGAARSNFAVWAIWKAKCGKDACRTSSAPYRLFEGGHEIVPQAAVAWMEKVRKNRNQQPTNPEAGGGK